MTVARNNIEPVLGDTSSPLAARLNQLVRRVITVEQFEAEMVRWCAADPEEIWNLLGLLDQYHRLDKLPTELFRSLKAAADRYGLVRRGPYIPTVTAAPAVARKPTPAVTATPAPTPVPRKATPAREAQRPVAALTAPPPRKHSWMRPLLLLVLLATEIAGAALSGLLPGIPELVSAAAASRTTPAPTPAPATATTTETQAAVADIPAAAPAVVATQSAPPAAPVSAPAPATIELTAGHYAVPGEDSAARIVVRRDGDLRGEVSFTWWTESATALADVDYIAWGDRTEKIAAGRSSVTLLVPIINDATRAAARSFTVLLSDFKGARPGATIRATVELTGTH